MAETTEYFCTEAFHVSKISLTSFCYFCRKLFGRNHRMSLHCTFHVLKFSLNLTPLCCYCRKNGEITGVSSGRKLLAVWDDRKKCYDLFQCFFLLAAINFVSWKTSQLYEGEVGLLVISPCHRSNVEFCFGFCIFFCSLNFSMFTFWVMISNCWNWQTELSDSD